MYALPLVIPTLLSLLSLPTPTLGLSEWYTPPGGPPTGSGFNATGNTSAGKIKGVNLGGYCESPVFPLTGRTLGGG